MSRDRALDALKRINDASQQTLERAADVAVRRSELGPATGFDTAAHHQSLSLPAWKTTAAAAGCHPNGGCGVNSPRSASAWPSSTHGTPPHKQTSPLSANCCVARPTRTPPTSPAGSTTARRAAGRYRPNRSARQLSNAELEVAALQRAVSTELQRRSAFVEHRDRLAGEAGRLAERAGEVYTAAINELAAARAELVDVRVDRRGEVCFLWAATLGSCSTGRGGR